MSQQFPYNPNQPQQGQPQYQGQQPYPGHQQPYPGAPAGYPGGPVPPPQKKSWFARHKALSIVGGVFLFFVVVGIAAGGGDDSGSNSSDTAASTPAKVDDKPAEKTDDKPAAPAKKTQTPAAKPKPAAPKPKEYVNGDYVVGEDIPEGTYTTPGAEKGIFEVCMVSTEPTSDSVFPQLKSANADERIIITLKKADGVVSISGCEPLTPRK